MPYELKNCYKIDKFNSVFKISFRLFKTVGFFALKINQFLINKRFLFKFKFDKNKLIGYTRITFNGSFDIEAIE